MSAKKIKIYCDYDERDSFYMHYRGNIYFFIGHAIHTETNEQLVIYKDCESAKIFARPAEMFFGKTQRGQERFKRVKLVYMEDCTATFEL